MKLSSVILCGIALLSSSNAIAGDCDFIQYNQCYSCDGPLAFIVGSMESCSYLCPNRTVNTEGSGAMWINYNCALKECPKNRPFAALNGSCFASKEEAEDNPFEYNTDNIYVPNAPLYDVNQSIAKDGICPPDKPLMDREGICYPCDAPIAIGLELNERLCTQACPKQRAMINGYCQLLKK